jgi:preprotein translocase subunit SecY
MIAQFFQKLRLVFADPTLRFRILFTLGALAFFRLVASIPLPGVNLEQLRALFASNQFFGLLDIFSGGGLGNLSIVLLGVGPYITSSIIMQLLTMMSPRLKALYQEEGHAGRRKFIQYSRILTVPLAAIQAFGFLVLLQRQGVLVGLTPFEFAVNVVIATAGSLFLMWLGELITEFGIGNGVSLIIFAGIIARIPTDLWRFFQTYDPAQLPVYIAFVVAAILIIYAVVYITEAERPVPVTYAKRVRGAKVYGGVSTYLPIRLTQAGVMPIIFALSLLLFPQLIFNYLATVSNETLRSVGASVSEFLNGGWVYAAAYFILVFLFTFFYTAVVFDPNAISQNLQKNGAFIPGVRPGESTAGYLARIITRLTLIGGLFLAFIAVLPLIMQAVTQNPGLAIGGTALLIVVSVVLDLFKKIDAQVSMREY